MKKHGFRLFCVFPKYIINFSWWHFMFDSYEWIDELMYTCWVFGSETRYYFYFISLCFTLIYAHTFESYVKYFIFTIWFFTPIGIINVAVSDDTFVAAAAVTSIALAVVYFSSSLTFEWGKAIKKRAWSIITYIV